MFVRDHKFTGNVCAYRVLNVPFPATRIEPEVSPISNPGYVVYYIYGFGCVYSLYIIWDPSAMAAV